MADKGAEDPSTKLKAVAVDPGAKLKILRRQRKAAITRHLGAVTRYMAERNVDAVKTRLATLSKSFSDLEDAHDLYHSTLEDDDKIMESEDWFADVEATYASSVNKANVWLQSMLPPDVKTQADVDGASASKSPCCSKNDLPKAELDFFFW